MISFRQFVEEDWKSSWKKAGEDHAVRKTGIKATDAAVRTAKNLGRGLVAGALLGAPGGPSTMKITIPTTTAIAAAGSTLAGDIPGAIYHGSKYVVQRGIKTAVNRVKEIANERRKRTTKAT